MNQSRPHHTVYVNGHVVIVVASLLVHAVTTPASAGIALSDLAVYENKSMAPTSRIDILHGYLLKEVQEPTEVHLGSGGGTIDHDYVLAQVVRSLAIVADKSPDARSLLQSRSQETHDGKITVCLQLALAMAGGTTNTQALTETLHLKGFPSLRALAIAYLAETNEVSAIPDMMDALGDTNAVVLGGDIGLTEVRESHPVRSAAFLALRQMNVTVKRTVKEQTVVYEVEPGSAVKAVAPLLGQEDPSLVARGIDAMERIGGEAAQTTLRRFITDNQASPTKYDLITRAREALAKLTPKKTVSDQQK